MMSKFKKITMNPITWIICAIACLLGVIVWFFKSKK